MVMAGKVCQISHPGLVWLWAGQVRWWGNFGNWDINWDMGTLSKMIAGHEMFKKTGKGAEKSWNFVSWYATWRTG